MTAKLKARQIISAWPRGRSSSRPIRIPTWFQFAFYKSLMDKRSSPIFGPSDADFEQFTRTNVVLFFEAEAEAKYRAGQDRMTEEWRDNHLTMERMAKEANPLSYLCGNLIVRSLEEIHDPERLRRAEMTGCNL
jgi:hypothetical protein